ncbi:23S rRNA (uracil(747)-C(5))-methyltransferase RlmC [Erwinia tracheiphila]|uniref:23S rRNA (uracil(747)-C(5))-methyltransferase RlmC n=1 Tax=Erwinia tracheiphila TaxID=65700 RepID=A0A0M2K6H8_9GAMM|nr:23S rRNA (uracil(747)-C(5))-methyltransferase RlmC [Erwinia tracheiphila]KKF34995.1 23S rRNA methyltransferase [Erwinia tracheiphila]UIA86660.1 23S rRNA (uracil(747)-C(5))-methyltransferase RlmC [Erwinia tracheiphila]UIA95015.1 23S rRNA (uracil(747)-C(5))-methyltransferase RlmC [Erwinia tracheiphila]
MYCALYNADRCHSCQWLSVPYASQIERKEEMLRQLLAGQSSAQWLPSVTSVEQGFRNKAKMVVSGSVERPVLGLMHRDGYPVDLCACPLYPGSFAAVFARLKPFIAQAGLTPYNVAKRRGELKFILLTESRHTGQLMLRFVLRSKEKIAQLTQVLPALQQQLPHLSVVSANIQPVPMAILEGDEEIPITENQSLAEQLNDVPLWIRPQSFFQTNPEVAALLYATARQWVSELGVRTMWDLFCGVGGFGLHCASPEMQLTGIEISAEAINCARRSATAMKLDKVSFAALDSTDFASGENAAPELVLVNPPRRGIGAQLCQWLSSMGPKWILYSSCNAQTLAIDIALMSDYKLEKVQLFDIFPHTGHSEVLTLLRHS